MNNPWEGLADLIFNSSAESKRPSIGQDITDFERFMTKRLGSDEYAAEFREREKRVIEVEVFLSKALAQGGITEVEYGQLLENSVLHGVLIVSRALTEKLTRVKE